MSIKIGKRFIIHRSSENINPDKRIPIILGSSRAFGSGEHETTRSCLEEMENIPIYQTSKILDLGCGTGILSIAAAKMGAQSVIALDPDTDAIEATITNIKLNEVEKIVLPLQGDLGMVKGERFDHILANLYGDILLTLINDIYTLLKQEGFLLLSGIQFEHLYELKTGFIKVGYKLLTCRFLEDYCTLLFEKH